MYAEISLNRLDLSVFLGWEDAERAARQTVALDLVLHFPTPPRACVTDALEDTVCYDAIAQRVRALCQDQPFRLLEHLGYQLYHTVREHLAEDQTITLRLTKHPDIQGLHKGATFTLSDKEAL